MKIKFFLPIVILLLVWLLPNLMPVLAADICYDPFCEQGLIQAGTGLGDVEPQIILARIINVCLGLLGIVSICLMVYAGARWTLARGNEEEVKKAQEILKGAVIGLVIVLTSYSVAYFVFTNLVKVSNAY